ncbi:MAG TPA: hypothetical protein PLE45_04485 [Spirochaetota bacterium]|nr:hypothetical protein [Spirochaetota bacterium]HOL57574.1 hypothetical protein [Spirochaetota bacterium]HPP05142.1 hypothetical protein [Spirochaetota bacterium]
MDINTGKLSSSSNLFNKKVKENDTNNKVSKVEDRTNSSKILNDFADIKFSSKDFKARIIENNNRLTAYENEISKLQYVEQQISQLEQYIKEKNSNKIRDILDNSIFNNENVLKGYFSSANNVEKEIAAAKEKIEKQYSKLDMEFKAIEIASQNILSLNPNSIKISEEIGDFSSNSDIFNSLSVNSKRVLELIS